jgi:hypothetical protein
VILDEAQFIKNPGAQVTQSVKQLKSEQRLALTGTPLENRLLDLWSIVDFIQPTYLGTQEHFNETYEPKGGEDAEAPSASRVAGLSAKLRPLMLRRLEETGGEGSARPHRGTPRLRPRRRPAQALPRRTAPQPRPGHAGRGREGPQQARCTCSPRSRGCARSAAIRARRQRLASGKTETLVRTARTAAGRRPEGARLLAVRADAQLLEKSAACATSRPTCSPAKPRTARKWSSVPGRSQPRVFLLSLRAAGTGLNLTTASYVVLYDPWWNPAVEAQAIDRSHRIGQTRTVNAYRLIAPGTVEEKIWELQQSKAQTIATCWAKKASPRVSRSTTSSTCSPRTEEHPPEEHEERGQDSGGPAQGEEGLGSGRRRIHAVRPGPTCGGQPPGHRPDPRRSAAGPAAANCPGGTRRIVGAWTAQA